MSHELPDSVTFAAPAADAYDALREMARRSFADAFAIHYDPEPFAAFLKQAYGRRGTMDRDLRDPAIRWLAGFDQTAPIGYAKLTPLRAPAPSPLPGALELQQIYVLSDWHGSGVAAHLMEWALSTAAEALAAEIYLTVFDHNERAKRFYRRYEFSEVGHCIFKLGDRVDDDRVWRRLL
jgi:ribosomal protein S18 acetylase RimI-like enzyme